MERDTVKELGLDYAFARKPDALGTTSGPGGSGAGLVFGEFDLMGDLRAGYYEGKQEWRKIPNSEAWVGYYPEALPTPGDLQRAQMLNGHWVELANETKWLAPIARSCKPDTDEFSPKMMVPVQSDVDENGKWIPARVADQYAGIWMIAARFWDHFATELKEMEGSSRIVEFEFEETHEAALEALQANYKVGQIEVSVLGLFSVQHCEEILKALIDWPMVLEWLKKKAEKEVLDPAAI